MPRILIDPRDITGSTIAIRDPKALHHLLHVLRIETGYSVECFDGHGRVYQGIIASSSRKQIGIQITRQQAMVVSTRTVSLYPALIRPERFDWMIEKATELGVEGIYPVITERTEHGRRNKTGSSRLARWKRLSESAASQCGRATLPQIKEPRPLPEVLGDVQGSSLLMPTLIGGAKPIGVLQKEVFAKPVAVLIGPEGDFTPAEVLLAESSGTIAVSLGSFTLRAETAAVVAVALVQLMLEKP